MNATERHRTAGAYVEWLRLAVHERDVPATFRVRAAMSCFAICQEHHHAIVMLVEERLYASSFALLRAAFEAMVRGQWLALCATESQVEKFLRGKEPPKFDLLLQRLEREPAFSEGLLSDLKRKHWKAMCAYTHTGGLHVQRWNTEHAIEPSYDPAEVQAVLFFAEIVASLSVLGFAAIVNDESLALSVLEQVRQRRLGA
jgi:hypothetical protein